MGAKHPRDGGFPIWVRADDPPVDFGSGPALCQTGHYATQHLLPSAIVKLLGGDTGLRVPVRSKEDLRRLADSPVFSVLAPKSGLLEGILTGQ
ncbi:hypothetical protein WJX73_001799 [Symbiochloris irregularis]|uniref:Uncharacterized protein n=1 Tax=Symbiochloris irregularis TaxID=706552 RepID=A0AAW1P0C7_9CHLO